MLHAESVVQVTVNGEGWEVQEFTPFSPELPTCWKMGLAQG